MLFRSYTVELIGTGASVNTTAAGLFAGIAQPVIGIAMVAVSQHFSNGGAPGGLSSVTDAGYATLIGILLLMSLPGLVGPVMMKSKLTVHS